MPQFFGPNRDGVVTGAGLARDWTKTPPRELWRQPIGTGWAAFSVVAGRAYTQEQRGEQECVTCYDLLSGRLLWSHARPTRFHQWQAGEGPHSTPTIDRGRLYERLGCPRAAVEDLVAYLSLSASPPDAAEVNERLARLRQAASRLH